MRWLSSPRPAPTPLGSLRYVVADTELSSLDKRSGRLLSVGAIAMDGPKIRLGEHLYRVVNPGPAPATRGVLVHGLRPCDLAGGEPLEQVLEELANFADGAVLVGHFIRLDLKILSRDAALHGRAFTTTAIDTAQVHRWLVRHSGYSEHLAHQLENTDLISLAAAYNLESREPHHALHDALLEARLWQKMLFKLDAMEVRTLAALHRTGAVVAQALHPARPGFLRTALPRPVVFE